MKDILYLNAKADKGEEEVLCYADMIQDLVKAFIIWTKERKITKDRLDCADIFKYVNRRKGIRLISLSIIDDGCVLTPVEETKKRKLFK